MAARASSRPPLEVGFVGDGALLHHLVDEALARRADDEAAEAFHPLVERSEPILVHFGDDGVFPGRERRRDRLQEVLVDLGVKVVTPAAEHRAGREAGRGARGTEECAQERAHERSRAEAAGVLFGRLLDGERAVGFALDDRSAVHGHSCLVVQLA